MMRRSGTDSASSGVLRPQAAAALGVEAVKNAVCLREPVGMAAR